MLNNKNKIEITRGDSKAFWIELERDNIIIPFEDGDMVYFTVKRSTTTTINLIQKVITNFEQGKAFFEIEPSDTKDLLYGLYWYDVQLTDSAGKVHTIIKPAFFEVLPEVTYE